MRREAEKAKTQDTGKSVTCRLLQNFLGHLANERRLSQNTVLNYGRDITALLELAADAPLAKLQIHHLRRFVAQLHARGLDGRTLARMLSAWRGFYRYLARDHGYVNNPCVGLRAPKTKKNLPQALSPDEAARLMEIPG
ncbi:MAG TPA: site-specific integrase, partial [Burkholderiales bacterium]|nr:site-specific integrase [Burkholderiales bacterium]